MKRGLISGISVLWSMLGVGNMAMVLICFFYLIKYLSWGQAARKSNIVMKRVQDLAVALNTDQEAQKGSHL